ncbi:terminase large subunit domain-containing protein [Sphingobacterium sp.]|uniref:terminase large subunit domain-containing protein n=1 Tax=Sphingobacterium sp. TaxID=341027 RepID=UPI0028B21BEA|nr:terminase family protein [Sphingobacterium sp.]
MVKEIDITLPTPHPKQREILNAYFNSTVSNITVSAGRRGGKSTIMCIIAIVESVSNNKKVGYIAPTRYNVKRFFKSILKYLPKELITVNQSDLTIEFENGGVIHFYSADGDSLDNNIRGGDYDVIVIDEAGFINDLQNKIEGAVGATLADRDGRLLMISTPNGKNYWYSLCQLNDGVNYKHFHYTSYDNPHIKKEVIDRYRLLYSTAQFNQEWLAIAGENANAFVDMEVIERNTIKTLSTNPTVLYGIDVAGTPNGDFTSVTGVDKNGVMTYHKHVRGYDTNIVYDMLSALPNDVLKVIDRTGMGQGVFDRLAMTRENWMGIWLSTTEKKDLINELRSALYQDKLKFNEITSSELSTYIATLNPKTGWVSYNSIPNCHDDTVISLGICAKYLEFGVTASPVEYMNRFSW